jgi:hypothetical protein
MAAASAEAADCLTGGACRRAVPQAVITSPRGRPRSSTATAGAGRRPHRRPVVPSRVALLRAVLSQADRRTPGPRTRDRRIPDRCRRDQHIQGRRIWDRRRGGLRTAGLRTGGPHTECRRTEARRPTAGRRTGRRRSRVRRPTASRGWPGHRGFRGDLEFRAVRRCGSQGFRRCASRVVRRCGSRVFRRCASRVVRRCGSRVFRRCASRVVRRCGSRGSGRVTRLRTDASGRGLRPSRRGR